MIKITKYDDLAKIKDNSIVHYIKNLLENILKSSSLNCSIESVGGIYFLENESDINRYSEFGLTSPINKERFEWIENLSNGYSDGCIVINNDFAINIIGKTEYFDKEDYNECS